MGDILPNDEKFRYKTRTNHDIVHIKLGNITKKVLKTIDSVMDVYFGYNADEFTYDQIETLRIKGHFMEANIKILWDLKQTLCLESERNVGMPKLHNHNHYPEHIIRFGAPLFANTDSFESAHRKYTATLWRNSSRRHGTLNQEMLMASILQHHNQHLSFYNTLFTMRADDILSGNSGFSCSPQVLVDHHRQVDRTPVSPIANCLRYSFKIKLDTNGYEEIFGHNGNKDYDLDDTYFGHNAVKCMEDIFGLITDYFWDLEYEDWHNEGNKPYRDKYYFNILQGVKFEANITSDILDHAFVYCTKYYKGKYKRYDYVVVNIKYDNGTEGRQVAQVVCVFDVIEDKDPYSTFKTLFTVQYLQDDVINPRVDGRNDDQTMMYKRLKWEVERATTGRRRAAPEFRVDLIESEMIVDVAVIIPFFSYYEDLPKKSRNNPTLHKMPTIGQPSIHDRFYYIERRYFDRSGWNESVHHQIARDYVQTNVDAYITRNSTSGRRNTPLSYNDNEDNDDDEEEQDVDETELDW